MEHVCYPLFQGNSKQQIPVYNYKESIRCLKEQLKWIKITQLSVLALDSWNYYSGEQGPTAQYICKIAQSSLYSRIM